MAEAEEKIDDETRIAREETLNKFCDALRVLPGIAISYLEKYGWDLDIAMANFSKTTLPRRPLRVESPPEGSVSEDFIPVTERIVTGSSPISSSQSPNPPEVELTRWKNERIVLFNETCVGASRREIIVFLVRYDWNLNLAINNWMDRRLPTPNLMIGPSDGASTSSSSQVHVSSGLLDAGKAKDAIRRSKKKKKPKMLIHNVEGSAQIRKETNAPDSSEHPSQLNDKLIASVCEATRTTRDNAIFCLKMCNYNPNQAASFFIDNLQTFQEKETWRGVPLQSQIRDSNSSVDANPTETGSLHEESGEESVTIATPTIASSQVDGNAVEEDEEKETFEIVLADKTVLIPFRPDETVRDIRHAIDDQLPPDRSRFYRLESQTDGALSDLNMTVQVILKRGCRTIMLVYPDDNHESSSSSTDADAKPTETGSLPEEAGEESLTLATLRIASSPVDGKAVEEDEKKETFEIVLADRTVLIPFRPEETVRDIRYAIDERLPPDRSRFYRLESQTDGVLSDLNMSVQVILKRGCRTIKLVYPEDN